MGSFTNKVVIITGASSGIGKATAVGFAKEGAKVVIGDVQENLGQDVAGSIRASGGTCEFIRCDVSKADQVKAMVDFTVKKFGRLDFAFNNAGTEGTPSSTVDCTEESWNKVIDTNLKSVWLCMKYEIPEMLKTGGGRIVNCASIAGLVGFQGIPPYVASKHGVVGLTKTAALEYAKTGLTVNAVCPGVIKTPMIDRFTGGSAEAEKGLSAGEPVGRVGRPEEVASAVLWLCSADAGFVTGAEIAVDGGWTAQ